MCLLQIIVKRGQKSRRDSHSTGLFYRKNTVNFEASFSSWYDDSLPQLPHHQPGPPPRGHGGVQVRRHQHHLPPPGRPLQEQCPGTN